MSDLATVTRAAPRGMITLRGDLSARAVKKAIKDVTSVAPSAGRYVGTAEAGVAWMSPDEVMILCAYDDVADALQKIATACTTEHHLAVDVSDARAVFEVRGAQAHEVLARLSPVDLHADRFEVGMMRRTRMAQIAAAFWRHDAGFDVICFRSVSDYAEELLANAAKATPTGALG